MLVKGATGMQEKLEISLMEKLTNSDLVTLTQGLFSKCIHIRNAGQFLWRKHPVPDCFTTFCGLLFGCHCLVGFYEMCIIMIFSNFLPLYILIFKRKYVYSFYDFLALECCRGLLFIKGWFVKSVENCGVDYEYPIDRKKHVDQNPLSRKIKPIYPT